MSSAMEPLSLNNPVFKTFLFYCGVLALKMLVMSIMTGRMRMKKQAFTSPEDIKNMKNAKVRTDEDVERVRRAHMNDLENIPIFMIICSFYLLTGPTPYVATMLIRIFAISRILHTLVYAVVVIPQPARALSWGVAYFITIYMAAMVVMKFMAFM